MKKRIYALKVYVALLLFTPLALIPSSGRSALLSSEPSASCPAPEKILPRPPTGPGFTPARIADYRRFLSSPERKMLAAGGFPLRAGGQQRSSPLSTNEAAAIVLTVLILACVVGFVEQNR